MPQTNSLGPAAMTSRSLLLSLTLAALLGSASLPAAAQWKYPDWSGQWTDLNTDRWDPSRPRNAGQQAPLIPEYQAALKAAAESRGEGGRGNTPTISCGHTGMPRSMLVYETMEVVIKPTVTYMIFDFIDPIRRIYTDNRPWPAEVDPLWMGYSIGQWEDEGQDGKYRTLAIETRHFRGPRILDGSGIPLHADNQTIIKERVSLDAKDGNVLHDEITLIDHAFTRPWTVTRNYKRNQNLPPAEYSCGENNEHVFIHNEAYFLSSDGYLMPTRKDQPPPDPRYFTVPAR
jgi:hypothetical protein